MQHNNTECPYCGVDYSDPNGVASDEYMYQGHILNDCPDPNKRERAYLNASAWEQMNIWP